MQTPNYSIRHSQKAKHVRLKVTPAEGLCVVIPRGFDETRIPGILSRKFELYNGQDFTSSEENARKLREPELASDAGGWTWSLYKGCNEIADNKSNIVDYAVVREITKKINGGVNHLGRRVQFFKRAKWHLCRDIDRPA